MMGGHLILLGTLLACMISLRSTHCSRHVKNVFINPDENGEFSHLVKDSRTGSIYIGAKNNLFKLDETLKINQTVSTGPKLDNVNCLTVDTCHLPLINMSSYNKALLVDEKNDWLITCSSLFQGHCEHRSLDNMTKVKDVAFLDNVVAKNNTATTVMFIGPGPSNEDDVLYVGVQYTERHRFMYAVSMRRIDNFKLFSETIASKSAVIVEALYRRFFYILYKYGFSSGGFSYFITIQRESANSKTFVSKLIRVCQKDQNFYSYIENKITCSQNGREYSIIQSAILGKPGLFLASYLGIPQSEEVLFATFTTSLEKPVEAVLCMFPMRNVRRVFTSNIKRCFGGIGTTGPDHLTTPYSCIAAGDNIVNSIKDDYCGVFEFNTPIDGSEDVTGEAIIKLDTFVTSLSVYTANKHTLLYVGSFRGKVYQILLGNNTGHIFNSYDLELRFPILQDTAFDDAVDHIYVLTYYKVYKVALTMCELYGSCDKCIEDPHCGWCTLEARCTKAQKCPDIEMPAKWLGYNSICVAITDMNLVEFSVNEDNEQQRFNMLATSLPDGEQYNCVYKGSGEKIITVFNRTDSKHITCDFPEAHKIPEFATDKIKMQLFIQLNNIDIVSTGITFFNCSTYTDCSSCTSSVFSCNWCINKNHCTHQPDLNCDRDDNVIFGINANNKNRNHSGSIGPAFCPQIRGDSDIYMTSGHSHNVSVTAYNILAHQLPFRCYFDFDGGKIVSAQTFATSNALTIQCDEFQMRYKENVSSKTIPFKIFWGDPRSPIYIDNPASIKVILYKCKFLGLTCGECLLLSNHYRCGWCSDKCEVHADCSNADWYIEPYVCSNVQITDIQPISGHYKGNTHLTIDGKNLGTSISAITLIKVAGVPCIPVEKDYIPPKRIVCKTGTYNMVVPGSGKVSIVIANKYNASSQNDFTFTDPIVDLISPLFGPSSGGTLGEVLGDYLDTGNEMNLTIASKSCDIIQRNKTFVVFLTPDHEEGDEQINITIDGHELTNWSSVESVFSYKKDPTITFIYPRKSFYAGYMDLTVLGTSLRYVGNPVMFVTYSVDGKVYRSVDTDCKMSNKSIMRCPSPPIEINNPNMTIITGSMSFVMDGVISVQKMSVYFPNVDVEIVYYKDPVVELQASIFNDKLIIKGEFWGVIETAVKVNITIDNAYCMVTVIVVDEIQCKIPDNAQRSGKIKVSINNGMFEFYPELLIEPISVSTDPSTITAIFGSVFMVVFLSILIPVLLKKRRAILRKQLLMTSERFPDLSNYQFLVQNNPEKYRAIPEDTLEAIMSFGLHIDRKYLEIMDALGEGQFGKVYKGRLQLDGVEQEDVAVKTVKGDNSDSIKEILEEALLMKDFKHENVISIIGIAISEKNLPLIVLPFMKHGDLLSYLRNESNNPTVAELVKFGLDIAKGMAYLSKIKYVHRDLAARNCMLDAELVAKVGDFGLSRDIYSTDYYTCDNKKKLPYRWMAPESMEDGKCTEKTDVWSFGVVLWELMTRGSTPYTGVGNWEILACLKGGMRLPRPMYCPVPLYEVMLKCWNYDPSGRPVFSVLENEISDLVSANMKNKTLPHSADDSYASAVDIQKCRYYHNVGANYNQSQSYIEVLPDEQQTTSVIEITEHM